MTKTQQIVYAANSFSTGVMIPVLTLTLLDKGSDLQTLPLLLMIYSLTVLCLELPSGILADMYGRKTVFLLSCGLMMVSFILLLLADKIVLLIIAIIFFGLGRAFCSGSLDALLIDQTLEAHGEGCIAKVTSRLAALESCGLAFGGLAGGLIYNLTGTYSSNIIVRLTLTAILIVLSSVFIKDEPQHGMKQQKQRIKLNEIIRQGGRVILSKPKFSLIFIGILFTGFFLFTVETYWQPALMQITPPNGTWVLGLVTFIGYFTIIFGNIIAQKLLDKSKISWWNVYNICRIAIAVLILVFAFQKSAAGFVCWYAGIYILLGAGNVAESSLINKYTPKNMRASMLSLSSLMTQIGGLCGSLFSSIMILRLHFSGIWIVAGAISGIFAIAVTIVSNIKYKVEEEMQPMLCSQFGNGGNNGKQV